MSIKVKGLFRGIKYITQMFDEGNKEVEIQIGLPTDVKHVAHIGWDGPAADDNPSWMNEFKGQSAPLGPVANEPKQDPEIKWVSEDPKIRKSRGISGELPELPKSTIRQSSSSENPDAAATKRRHSRRRHSRDVNEIGGATAGSESSAAKDNPNLPKKSQRKKSKDPDAVAAVTAAPEVESPSPEAEDERGSSLAP